MFFIQKKLPRGKALGEPLLHENHKRPVTRREMLGAGLMSAPAMVVGPAFLGSLLKAGKANALDADIQALLAAGQCNIPTGASGIPFICFDLAGGANLVGSEVIVGTQGGQANFLSTAGYGKLGLPGSMVPTAGSNFVDSSFGLLWHSDGAILRGMKSKATTPATAANTSGAVICAMSQNDTGNNPHNPLYGIAETGAKGSLLTLIGTQSSVSGGNSAAPMNEIQAALQPTKIAKPGDATSLVNTGGATADPVAVAVMESQARISSGTAAFNPTANDPAAAFTGVLTEPGGNAGVQLYQNAAQDAALKNQIRCAYVTSAHTADAFGNPAALDPTKDTNIIGGASPIFTASDFSSNSDVQKTATVMKLVLNGFAAAGCVTLSGFDYHDSTRATGETRNFQAGQMIGAVLEYAQRLNTPVMVYVFSDGSLSSSSTIDNSTAGRGKLGWQGDNQSVASTFFLVYSPKGRPGLRNGVAGQQIGYFSSGGSVVSTSSPAANAVTQIAETVILNYLALSGKDGQFGTLFPMQGLGSSSVQQGLISFAPIA